MNEATTQCILYVPDDNEERSPLALCANIKGISQTHQDHQVCAYVIGIMINMVPARRQQLLDLIKFRIDIIALPSQAEVTMLDLTNLPIYDNSTYSVLLGFCFLLLFKNCTQQNYSSFAHFAGVAPDEEIPNPSSFKKAQAVREVLGSIPELKRLVIEFIINWSKSGRTSFNCMMAHLASLLEYNEMSAFRFCYETLILSESPVLKDPRVSDEVSNLYEALGLVNRSEYPKYFRYLAPKEQSSKIDRARFPTLAAVAQKIKAEVMGNRSVLQMVSFSSKGVT
ncbi:hypothetical protein DCAR_0102341 [Daucus carota subsp. sativus]|uniref:Uncharacterized protein n=1 Tax=Daucus carota subsp. sativus TaxID=79200 RepID=A0A166H1F9_DAUCS|nr:hypothetical protein DCAR_0102341 [Daucus carota subsp. sativus]